MNKIKKLLTLLLISIVPSILNLNAQELVKIINNLPIGTSFNVSWWTSDGTIKGYTIPTRHYLVIPEYVNSFDICNFVYTKEVRSTLSFRFDIVQNEAEKNYNSKKINPGIYEVTRLFSSLLELRETYNIYGKALPAITPEDALLELRSHEVNNIKTIVFSKIHGAIILRKR